MQPLDYRPALIIGTTTRCNFRCRMCFWSNPETAAELKAIDAIMPMDMFQRVLDEVLPYCSTVCLAGSGEWLTDPLIDDRLEILGKALRDNPKVFLFQTTNASLLTKERLEFLRGIRKVGFTISIDSCDPLVYSYIRRGGDLIKTITNIRSLRGWLEDLGVKNVLIQLNVVLMKCNVFSLPGVIKFAKEIRAKVFVDHPQGFGPGNLSEESLFGHPVFCNEYMARCRRLAEVAGVEVDFPSPFAVTDEEIKTYREEGKQGLGFCEQLNQRGPIQIGGDGAVSVCCQDLRFGSMKKKPFSKIMEDPRFDEYREAIQEGHPIPPCAHCRHLYRKASFIYDSSVYGLHVYPESRCLDSEDDLRRKNVFDGWRIE